MTYFPRNTASRPLEVLVASSQAPVAVKANADYVCDGTGDEATINSAITAAAAQPSPITTTTALGGGGKVVLSAGRFNIANPIVLKTGVFLQGQGMLTEIFAASAVTSGAGAMISLFDTATHATRVSSLWLNGNGATGNCHGMKYVNTGSTFSGRPDTNPDAVHRIDNVDITNTDGAASRHGIWLNGTSGGPRGTIMQGIRIFGTSGHGVWLDGASDAHIAEVQTQVDGSGHYGFNIGGGNAQLTTCKAFYSDSHGFYLGSSRSTLTNCVAQDNGEYGFYVAGADANIVGGQADSNSRLSGTGGGLYTGINFHLSGMSFFDRGQTPGSPQLRGIVFGASLTQAMVFAHVKVPSGSDHVVNSANFTGGANNVGRILRSGTTPISVN